MFTVEQVYGVTRQEYYVISGITPEEMVRSLEAEVMVMLNNLDQIREEFRNVEFISDEGRTYASLIKYIEGKIASKRDKISDIKSNDL